jgi:cell division protein FtsW (lipid II flippase)
MDSSYFGETRRNNNESVTVTAATSAIYGFCVVPMSLICFATDRAEVLRFTFLLFGVVLRKDFRWAWVEVLSVHI